MPRWRALTDLTLPDGVYVQAGTSFDAPLEWHPPTNAVQPLDPDATERYWHEGPRGMSDAEPYRARFTNCARWSDVPVFPPTTYWVPSGKGFILVGGGENYGVHDPV